MIRLNGCPGWFESLLGAHAISLVLSCAGPHYFWLFLLMSLFVSRLCFFQYLGQAVDWDCGLFRVILFILFILCCCMLFSKLKKTTNTSIIVFFFNWFIRIFFFFFFFFFFVFTRSPIFSFGIELYTGIFSSNFTLKLFWAILRNDFNKNWCFRGE